MGRIAPHLFIAAVSLVAVGSPPAARADAIQIQMLTKVPAGQRPKLTVTARQAVSHVEIMLSREDGSVLGQELGAIDPGTSRELLLDAAPGKHRYSGRITFVGPDGVTQSSPLSLDTMVGGKLEVNIDKSLVDLASGRMPIRVSVPEGKVEVRIFGATGGPPLFEHRQGFANHDPALALTVSWKPLPRGTEVGRVEVKVSDASGAFESFSLHPWSVHIPHEEVSFATDSAAIAPAEAPKLQASLARIADALARHRELGPIKLYVAGHTDTVGKAPYNLGLSRKRAQSIAGWFRKHGLRIPIAYEGFGEHALLVGTPDEKDEPRNRRVDYILAIEDPVLKATSLQPVWKTVR